MHFSNDKLLLLLFSSCSLGKFDLQASNSDPSTRTNHQATIQSKQQVQLRTIHQYKRKALKERTKNKARCYDYKSARKAKNGTKVEKKRLLEDLYY